MSDTKTICVNIVSIAFPAITFYVWENQIMSSSGFTKGLGNDSALILCASKFCFHFEMRTSVLVLGGKEKGGGGGGGVFLFFISLLL